MQMVFDKLKLEYWRIVVKTTSRPAEKGQGIDLSSCDNRTTALRSTQIGAELQFWKDSMNQTSSPRLIERPQSFCQYVHLQLSDGYGVGLET